MHTWNESKALAYNVFVEYTITPDRWQSKTLMLSTNVDKTVENRVYDCHLSLASFDPRSSTSKVVFDCCLSRLCLCKISCNICQLKLCKHI